MSVIQFGGDKVSDPRTGEMVYPWTINVLEDLQQQKLSLEITGVPEQPPFVGEEFDAYIFVKARTPFQACEGETPDSDVIRVQWDIYNGPTASVEVEDMKATASQSVETCRQTDR